MLRLRVSRNVVVLEGPDRTSESTSAVVALTVDRGKVGICSVGETDEEVVSRVTSISDASKGAIAARLVAAAEQRASGPSVSGPRIRLVRPGEDPWWDQRIHDPYSLRAGEHRRSHDPREVLVVRPLAHDTWSPHLLRGLMMYVFCSSQWTRLKTWPSFVRPPLELLIGDDISGVDREELIDTIRSIWGRSRIHLPPGQDVSPLPMTRMRAVHGVTRAVWWIGAILMVVMAHPEPGAAAVVAAAIAAAALFTSRILGARLEAQRPRRSGGGAAAATSR